MLPDASASTHFNNVCLDSERLRRQEWKCTAVQLRVEPSEQPLAADGTGVHVMFIDGWYKGLTSAAAVKFGDGTRFAWSRICAWHAAADD